MILHHLRRKPPGPSRRQTRCRISQRAMFPWSGRQVVFFLAMVFVCGMAFIYPAWRHWYSLLFPPLFVVVAALAFRYAARK